MKTVSIETVTPDDAKTMLANNLNNRHVNKAYVKLLASDMGRRVFQDNGATICLDEEGNILDGQHRLLAIVESGVTLSDVIVVRGLKPESFATIDSGRPRTNGDRLAMMGIKNSSSIAACARAFLLYKLGDLAFGARVSNVDVLETAKEHAELFKKAQTMAHDMNKAVRGQPAVYASTLALCLQHDREQTEEFCHGVISGANLKEGDPRLAFRKYMIGLMASQARIDRAEVGEALRQALNAWMSSPRKSVSTLRHQKGVAHTPLFFAPVQTRAKTKAAGLMPLLEGSAKTAKEEDRAG